MVSAPGPTMRERKERTVFREMTSFECSRVILEVVSSRHMDYLVWRSEEESEGWSPEGAGGG